MTSLEFTVNESIPFSFEPYLFNRPQQLLNQSEECLLLQLKKGTMCVAIMGLFLNDGKATSPYRAPFGSIDYDSSLTYKELDWFINQVLTFSSEKGASSIKVVAAPECYSYPKAQLLSFLLLKNHFSLHTQDLNFHLKVEEEFESKLHYSELRRLKKCQRENFQFRIGKGEEIPAVYSLVKSNREEKGFPVSITRDLLEKLFINHPGQYLTFTLWHEDLLIACAIGVKVSDNILYYFIPADHANYRTYSPTVLLIKQIYDYCKTQSVNVLDLGIATAAGVPNEGLIRFKENIGGIPSMKFTYVKKLNEQE